MYTLALNVKIYTKTKFNFCSLRNLPLLSQKSLSPNIERKSLFSKKLDLLFEHNKNLRGSFFKNSQII